MRFNSHPLPRWMCPRKAGKSVLDEDSVRKMELHSAVKHKGYDHGSKRRRLATPLSVRSRAKRRGRLKCMGNQCFRDTHIQGKSPRESQLSLMLKYLPCVCHGTSSTNPYMQQRLQPGQGRAGWTDVRDREAGLDDNIIKKCPETWSSSI